MARERVRKLRLLVVGLVFSAGVYPLMMSVKRDPARAMMMSLYVTLGIFLLLAARKPSANDRFHGMVELSSRRAYGGAGIP